MMIRSTGRTTHDTRHTENGNTTYVTYVIRQPFTRLSVFPSFRRSLSRDRSLCLSVCPSNPHLTLIHPSVHLSIYPSIHLSIYLSIYLSATAITISVPSNWNPRSQSSIYLSSIHSFPNSFLTPRYRANPLVICPR